MQGRGGHASARGRRRGVGAVEGIEQRTTATARPESIDRAAIELLIFLVEGRVVRGAVVVGIIVVVVVAGFLVAVGVAFVSDVSPVWLWTRR